MPPIQISAASRSLRLPVIDARLPALAASGRRSAIEIANSTVNATSTSTAAMIPSELWPAKRATSTIATIRQTRPMIAVRCSAARLPVVRAAQARRLISSEAKRITIQPPAASA